jgi:hypothetical protein
VAKSVWDFTEEKLPNCGIKDFSSDQSDVKFHGTSDLNNLFARKLLSNTSQPFRRLPFKDMYAWNYFLTRELEGCLNSLTSYHCYASHTRSIRTTKTVRLWTPHTDLDSRRSRHFAGTRYPKRGQRARQVATTSRARTNFARWVQIGFWRVHSPPISKCEAPFPPLDARKWKCRSRRIGTVQILIFTEGLLCLLHASPCLFLFGTFRASRVDPTYTANLTAFQDLVYPLSGSPICAWDLVKQSESGARSSSRKWISSWNRLYQYESIEWRPRSAIVVVFSR